MINDPELKAMSEVFEALKSLDRSTQKRVVDWVLSKLESSPLSEGAAAGAKRGPKPGKKRGPKPGSKRKGRRGRPPGSKNLNK